MHFFPKPAHVIELLFPIPVTFPVFLSSIWTFWQRTVRTLHIFTFKDTFVNVVLNSGWEKKKSWKKLTCASCGMKDIFISLHTRMYFAQYSFILLNRSSGQSEMTQVLVSNHDMTSVGGSVGFHLTHSQWNKRMLTCTWVWSWSQR